MLQTSFMDAFEMKSNTILAIIRDWELDLTEPVAALSPSVVPPGVI
jgi:hypothetical protein